MTGKEYPGIVVGRIGQYRVGRIAIQQQFANTPTDICLHISFTCLRMFDWPFGVRVATDETGANRRHDQARCKMPHLGG